MQLRSRNSLPAPYKLGVLCIVLLGLGAALDRAAGLLCRPRVTIETGTAPLATTDAPDEWERMLAGGDPAAGERLFFDAGHASRCSACHAFNGRGDRRAPNLTRAAARPLPQLVGDIVNPHAQLTRGFETVTVFSKDGRVITGWKHGADFADKLLVRRDDGTVIEFALSEIEERVYDTAMPKNYAALLSLQDLRDLVALLRTGVKQSAPTQQEAQQQDQVARQESAGSR